MALQTVGWLAKFAVPPQTFTTAIEAQIADITQLLITTKYSYDDRIEVAKVIVANRAAVLEALEMKEDPNIKIRKPRKRRSDAGQPKKDTKDAGQTKPQPATKATR